MSRKRVRALLLVLILATLGGIGYKVTRIVSVKVDELQEKPLKLLNQLPEVTLQVKDFHHTKIQEGRKVWELLGEEARYLKNQQEAIIKKPRMIFYHQNGDTIEAVGNEGHLFFTDKELEKLELHGAIQMKYQGLVLNTEEATYVKSENHVVAPGKVTLRGDGLELQGVGMEIALQDDRIRVLQQVKTKLQPEKLHNLKLKPNGNKNRQ